MSKKDPSLKQALEILHFAVASRILKQEDGTQENLMMQANLALAALPFTIVYLLQVLYRINPDTTGDFLRRSRARLRLQVMSCLLAVVICPVTSLCAQSRTFHNLRHM